MNRNAQNPAPLRAGNHPHLPYAVEDSFDHVAMFATYPLALAFARMCAEETGEDQVRPVSAGPAA